MRTCKVISGLVILFWVLSALASDENNVTVNKPEDLIHVFYQALDEGNTDKAMTLISLADVDEEQKAEVLQRINDKMFDYVDKLKNRGGLDRIEILSIQDTGERATVEVKVLSNNRTEQTETMTFSLKQQADGWKIVNLRVTQSVSKYYTK